MATATTSKSSGLFGVKELKIAPLLTDIEGSAPTYSDFIKVPGVKSLTLKKNITSKENKGDEKILDVTNIFDSVTVSFENAELSLDTLAAIAGTTVVTNGTDTAQVFTVTESAGNVPIYFKLVARPKKSSAGNADSVLTFYKVTGTLDYSLKNEDYATVSFSGKAIPIKGTINSQAYAVGTVAYSASAITD